MKKLTPKQKTAIGKFIKERIGGKPLCPLDWLCGEIECLHHNVANHSQKMKESAPQRRAMIAELERLKTAFDALSFDTRLVLSMQLAGGIAQVEGRHEWMASGDHIDGLGLAIDSALSAASPPSDKVLAARKAFGSSLKTENDKSRGAGHTAMIRRSFVVDAGRVFIMAGGKTLSQADESVFSDWLVMLDDTLVMGLRETGQSFKRAIRDAIGNTATERAAWEEKTRNHRVAAFTFAVQEMHRMTFFN